MKTKAEIGEWFDRGVAKDAAYMLVICDTFDWDDYPVFCSDRAGAEAKAKYPGNMQKVMEIYDLKGDRESQLSQHRAWAFTPTPPKAA